MPYCETCIYFGTDGTKISKYIENAVTMNAELLRIKDNIVNAANVFAKIHLCGVDTGVAFEVFEMAEEYENFIISNNVELYEDYPEIKKEVMRIKQSVDKGRAIRKVPCHNDPLCENWIESNGRLYLIDWEYAGMNDAMWDLADLSIEAGYTDEHDEILLGAYFERDITLAE